MTHRVSFIVPVRNDAVRLATCLRSIWGNTHAPGQVEVVVVDNGSTDNSAEVAGRLGARVIVIQNGRVSELRNQGARHATGEILAFVDADNEITAGWLDAAIDALQTVRVGAVGARYLAPADGTWVQRAYGHLRGRTEGRRDVSWLGSGNLAVWRHTFEAVGGFDTSLEACEDVDLCHRIRANALRIVGDRLLESVHHGDPKTLSDLFVGELWRGRDNLRVSLRRPISWAALPSALIPVVDALMIGVAMIGLVTLPAARTSGLLLVASAELVIAGGAAVKVVKAILSQDGLRGLGILQAFVVACVYDLARALAVIVRAPHRSSRPRTAPAPS